MKVQAFIVLYCTILLGLLPGVIWGQLSSFTVIIAICLHGFFANKTTRPQNICMGLLGYLISVIVNNLVSAVYSLFNQQFLKLDAHFLTFFVPAMFVVTFLFSYYCGKMINQKVLSIKELLQIRQVWYLADVTLLLCSIVFAFNNTAGEKAGYPVGVVYFNCILFTTYFFITVFLLVSIFKAYREKVQADMKQKSFQELQKYTQNLEAMYGQLRSFKHDYINILTSMSGYIENGDMKELKVFFEEKISPIRTLIMQGDYKLNHLSNIGVLEIKSLLSAKMIYAYELGIDVTIDIPDFVDGFSMDILDLARVLGIFLDNAIEAALETKQPKVGLCIIQNAKTVAVVISNSYCDTELPLHELKQYGFTTKGGHQGIGLSNAQRIISQYDFVFWETSKHRGQFSQYMEISTERSA